MLRRIARAVALAAALASPAVASAQDSRTAATRAAARGESRGAATLPAGNDREARCSSSSAKTRMRKIAPRNGFFVDYGYTGKAGRIGNRRECRLSTRPVRPPRACRLRDGRDMAALPHRPRRLLATLARARASLELGVEGDRPPPTRRRISTASGAASLDGNRVSFLFDRREVQGRAVVKPGGGFADRHQVGPRGGIRLAADATHASRPSRNGSATRTHRD